MKKGVKKQLMSKTRKNCGKTKSRRRTMRKSPKAKRTGFFSFLKGGNSTQLTSNQLASKYLSCGAADRHNLQTSEANLDLIQGAGSLPANQMGGNGACPGNGKILSFKDYTRNIAAALGVNSPVMNGGGYAIDPSAEQIGGQPARVGYSDCCPPVSLEGRLLMGANSGAVCGQQAGGKKRRTMRRKKTTGKRKGKKSTMNKQMGGDSSPALFPTESHPGVDGDFSDQGPQLHYDGRQPFWDATTR